MIIIYVHEYYLFHWLASRFTRVIVLKVFSIPSIRSLTEDSLEVENLAPVVEVVAVAFAVVVVVADEL